MSSRADRLREESPATVAALRNVFGLCVSVLDYIPHGEHAAIRAFTSTYDCTESIANAQAALADTGGAVDFPPGLYCATKITRQSRVSLAGQSSRTTYLKALPSSNSDPCGFVEIADGPVVFSHMSGFTLIGSDVIDTLGGTVTNADQWAMYLHAKWDASYTDGGLWQSRHSDILARNFNYGLWSRGGYTNAHTLRPNQFLIFDGVFLQVMSGGTALRFTGQHGQVSFRGGAAEGQAATGRIYRCVELDWDPDPASTADDSSGHGESTADASGVGNAVVTPANITFSDGFSPQVAEYGAYLRNTQDVTFDGCWWENMGGMIELAANASVTLRSNHIANAGDGARFVVPAAGTGFLVKQGSGTRCVWGDGNRVVGTADEWLDGAGSSMNSVNVASFKQAGVSSKDKFNASGHKAQTVDASGGITTLGHYYVTVSSNSDRAIKLATIDSYLAPGERLVLQGTSPFTLAETGNILLPGFGISELTIGQQGVVVLERIAKVGTVEWQVVSATDIAGTAAPADGYYYAIGARVINRTPTSGGTFGWVCTTAGLAGTTAVFKAFATIS